MTITWLDDETARVVWEQPDPIEIQFTRISETIRADAVVAIITIHTGIANVGRVAGPIRVNLYSSSAIDSLRRACQNVTDIPDWQRILGDSMAAVLDGYGIPQATDADLNADTPTPGWLLKPLLESEGYTVIYARGGSGKSYLAAALAVSVACGEPVFGSTPVTTGPVAYLDWESTSDTFNHRIKRICSGLGIDALSNRIRHYRMSGPFAARRASLTPELSRLNPALIIIDSKGRATTGAPESSEGILDLARALRYLKTPVLLIDHISKGAIKGEDPDMAFGSQYVEASARLAWSLKTTYKPGAMTLHMRNTKANNHARAEPFAFDLMFAGDSVVMLGTQSEEPMDLPKHAADIIDWLTDNGPARIAEIADALEINKGSVSRILNNTPGFHRNDDLWSVFVPAEEIPF